MQQCRAALMSACVGLTLLFGSLPASAEDKKPIEPTPEQLQAAKDAFAKLGAEYQPNGDPGTKRIVHWFVMPSETTDADLKKLNTLPQIPFSFGLSLTYLKVTDAGL